MKNINKLIFRVNDNLRNNLDVDKNDIKKLLNIAMEMEKQLAISHVVGRSEQLVCVVDYLSNFTKGKKYECKPDGKNYVETYDDFGDWYSVHKKCFSRTEVAN